VAALHSGQSPPGGAVLPPGAGPLRWSQPEATLPLMTYVGQFDHLIRDVERGRAILNTRTIAVFDDGLVVCAVPVYGEAAKPAGSLIGRLWRAGYARERTAAPGRGAELVRARAAASGSSVTFAETWPKARLIPLAVVEQVVLRRPRQVSELTVRIQTRNADAESAVFLGDLPVERVREVLGAVLGERLKIDITE
jgi:hypothetical protein